MPLAPRDLWEPADGAGAAAYAQHAELRPGHHTGCRCVKVVLSARKRSDCCPVGAVAYHPLERSLLRKPFRLQSNTSKCYFLPTPRTRDFLGRDLCCEHCEQGCKETGLCQWIAGQTERHAHKKACASAWAWEAPSQMETRLEMWKGSCEI